MNPTDIAVLAGFALVIFNVYMTYLSTTGKVDDNIFFKSTVQVTKAVILTDIAYLTMLAIAAPGYLAKLPFEVSLCIISLVLHVAALATYKQIIDDDDEE